MERTTTATIKGHARTTSIQLYDNEQTLPSPEDFEPMGVIQQDAEGQTPPASPRGKDDGAVTWASLPRKDQLTILFLSRLVDFLQVASLQAYVFYQLKSFDDTLSDAQISSQAGLLQGAFTGAQVLTAFLWGKAADSSWCGRKNVLIIGLFGTAISCIGYGFATSFWAAAFWRAAGGAINGTVGIIRTMITEITVERKYQSRAFLILPISFSVASTLGPLMGGLLADPVLTFPGLFGEGAIWGFDWVFKYPYALPSLINTVTLTITGLIVVLGLEETSSKRRNKFDPGLHLARRLRAKILREPINDGYYKLESFNAPGSPPMNGNLEKEPIVAAAAPKRTGRSLPFSRVWTRNVIFTLVTEALFDFQLGAFTNLWTLFLSSPRSTPEETAVQSLPWIFTGGLGMPAATVGLATSVLGVIGMVLQIFAYPSIHARLGTLRGFRYFMALFPVAYFLTPYLAVLPSATEAPAPASGIIVWMFMTVVQVFQVMARTVTLPASIILLNNCSPHPSVLGLVHGLGQSVSAGFRTVGPVVGGWWYGAGLEAGVVGASWWAVAGLAALGCASSFFIYEGSGHEIILEGEEDEKLIS
ncbi:putative MFS transporter [Rosellinia necatrix]|uniref:Putative MFS transporter n=1 Tax=Rosellinia necatrix TaxID=77044 RepID=A0A1W2TF31_ROSNE|nr:putative MFS transporter [Rosellinia necatrix]